MALIIENDYYQYVALGFATTFLLPQLRIGYKNKSLKEVSSASFVLIVIASTLWGIYMFEQGFIYYVVPTAFVGICAIIGLIMQATYYYRRLNEHMTSFDQPPAPTPVAITCPHCTNDNNV